MYTCDRATHDRNALGAAILLVLLSCLLSSPVSSAHDRLDPLDRLTHLCGPPLILGCSSEFADCPRRRREGWRQLSARGSSRASPAIHTIYTIYTIAPTQARQGGSAPSASSGSFDSAAGGGLERAAAATASSSLGSIPYRTASARSSSR